jgi:hypothetical protein
MVPSSRAARQNETSIAFDIFPNDEAIVRPVGAILLEQNDEWAVQRALLRDPGNHGRLKR